MKQVFHQKRPRPHSTYATIMLWTLIVSTASIHPWTSVTEAASTENAIAPPASMMKGQEDLSITQGQRKSRVSQGVNLGGEIMPHPSSGGNSEAKGHGPIDLVIDSRDSC